MNPVPPFDNLEIRWAVAMAIDRKAFVDIMTQGEGDCGQRRMRRAGGRWGLPPEMLQRDAGLRSRRR